MQANSADLEDLETLRETARAAAALAVEWYNRADWRAWDKAKGHPVTEADIAVNTLIRERLMAARPDYGWL